MLNTQRYSAKIRKQVKAQLVSAKTRYPCAKCGKSKVRKQSFSIWQCQSCSNTFAGAAYSPSTEAGELAERLFKDYSKLI